MGAHAVARDAAGGERQEDHIMNHHRLGKFLLTFVLVIGAILATAVDWNTTHLFNPAWHPHARFHDAMYLLLLDTTSILVLWLLWRGSTEPDLGVTVAALFSLAVWTPFFYIEALIPGTSPIAEEKMPVVHVGGMRLAPNVIIAAVLVLLTLIGYWLARRPIKPSGGVDRSPRSR